MRYSMISLGALMLAAAAPAMAQDATETEPASPVTITGSSHVMKKGRLRTEPGDVELIVHDPIYPAPIASPTVRDAKRLADQVHAIVSAAVSARGGDHIIT